MNTICYLCRPFSDKRIVMVFQEALLPFACSVYTHVGQLAQSRAFFGERAGHASPLRRFSCVCRCRWTIN